MPIINIFSRTHVGMHRENNEDSTATLSIKTSDERGEIKYHVLILADGMGGYERGEAASQLACRELGMFAVSEVSDILLSHKDDKTRFENFRDRCTCIASKINTEIRGMVSNDESRIGSTFVMAVIYNDIFNLAYMGDSRAYLIQNGGIEQITRDHSYVEALLENKAITPEEALDHPMKNVITKGLGINEKAEPDFIHGKFSTDSALILCSDGVTDMLIDGEIKEIAHESKPFEMCDRIVEASNAKGGKDNISIVMARLIFSKVKKNKHR